MCVFQIVFWCVLLFILPLLRPFAQLHNPSSTTVTTQLDMRLLPYSIINACVANRHIMYIYKNIYVKSYFSRIYVKSYFKAYSNISYHRNQFAHYDLENHDIRNHI